MRLIDANGGPTPASASGDADRRRRALAGACLAHVIHDGCTDGIYVLLPVWGHEFGLGYAALAVLRSLYSGTMGALQLPADRRTRGVGARPALVGATLLTGAGFTLMSVPGLGLASICLGLLVAGVGSSLQHPRGSTLVTDAFGPGARRPLGTYNFAGDGGKALFPPLIAGLLIALPSRGVTAAVAAVVLLGAGALGALLPRTAPLAPAATVATGQGTGARRGFRLLLALGVLDTATRMDFLLFLSFLITAKGGSETIVGGAFAALYIGGAFGKAVCGRLPDRFGVSASVIATELATAALIVAVLALPLLPALAILPVLGVVLNGTSSVFYGTVPELAPTTDLRRAFARFYTAVIVSGAVAPIGFGLLGDSAGRTVAVLAATATALFTVPTVLAMRRHLARR